MTKLFNGIRKKIISEKPSVGRTTNYLKYAIGEIVLVVIGILIALSINNWNEHRKNAKTEQRLLTGLQQGITEDLKTIELELAYTNKSIIDLNILDSLLKLDVPKPSKKLNQLFGNVYGLKILNLNKALYEDIKSVGFGIIQDEKLRSQIINVFENDYFNIEKIKVNERSINKVNRPFYLENFVDIRFSAYAKPNNLQVLLKDSYYKNIVYYRMITLQINQQKIYKKTIEDINVLLGLIEKNIE